MSQFELTSNESLGREYLLDFLGSIITDFKAHKLSSESLLHLSKAYYLIDNYKKLNYAGYLRIETNATDEDNNSQSYVCLIHSDEVVLSYEGYTHGEYGGDSEYEQLFNFDDDDEFDDPIEKITHWIESFNALFDSASSLSIEDSTENIQEILFDDLDEDE
ncbi:MAG: hypothetical protein RL660_642 [Bacteroidota bacterium]|jgi:hypothetical protein